MPDLIVELSDDVIRWLEREAVAHGRTVEDEHRFILERELSGLEPGGSDHRAAWATHARKLRRLTAGAELTPSEDLIRAARDEG